MTFRSSQHIPQLVVQHLQRHRGTMATEELVDQCRDTVFHQPTDKAEALLRQAAKHYPHLFLKEKMHPDLEQGTLVDLAYLLTAKTEPQTLKLLIPEDMLEQSMHQVNTQASQRLGLELFTETFFCIGAASALLDGILKFYRWGGCWLQFPASVVLIPEHTFSHVYGLRGLCRTLTHESFHGVQNNRSKNPGSYGENILALAVLEGSTEICAYDLNNCFSDLTFFSGYRQQAGALGKLLNFKSGDCLLQAFELGVLADACRSDQIMTDALNQLTDQPKTRLQWIDVFGRLVAY